MAIDITLKNVQNFRYTSMLYVGSKQVGGELVYDTGSGWLAFGSSGCIGCPTSSTYDPKLSTTASNLSQTSQLNVTIVVIYYSLVRICHSLWKSLH